MEEVKIEPATLDDRLDIAKLVNCCYRSDESRKGWTSEADIIDGLRATPEMIEDDMNQPDSQMFKAIDSSKSLIGCVYTQKQGVKMHFGMMCVRPSLQACGIGRKLLNFVYDYAKSQSCESISIEVVNVRQELIDWYIRRGFVRTGVTEPFPAGGVTSLYA